MLGNRLVNGRETTPSTSNIGENLKNAINDALKANNNGADVKIAAAAEPASANYGYHGHDEGVTGYPGTALTVTGTINIVGAKKAGVEATALFEVRGLTARPAFNTACCRHSTTTHAHAHTRARLHVCPHPHVHCVPTCCPQITPFFWVGTGGPGVSSNPPANAPFVRNNHLQIQFTREEGPHGSGY